MTTMQFSALQVTQLAPGIPLARLASPGKVNTLNNTLWNDLAALLAWCEEDQGVEGLVIASGKPGVFLAGADLREFVDVTPEALANMLARAHAVFERMETLRVPVVAAVDGMALGGGLELLLATHGVVAVDDKRIKFGLPETSLGLIPGAGGTQRLPLYAGLFGAIDLICSARPFTPASAATLGIVDRLAPQATLLAGAVELVAELQTKGHRGDRLRRRFDETASSSADTLLAEALAADPARSERRALQAACEAVIRGAFLPFPEGAVLESALFSELMHAPDTQRAIRAFLGGSEG